MNRCNPNSQDIFAVTEAQLADEKAIASQAKALSHPARLRILKILSDLERQGGCLNSDLVSQLGLAQSTVSEHLRILKVAGFIHAEAMPPKVCYRIDREAFNRFSLFTQTLFD
ncbi:ArsR/SmtB family transcription factor [Vibrio hippocampi]|uniref:HTH arsR-type domain-containing protein n=1 Tax=Vibrio hippocampi TaxID=654686 RepID=A0ABN8DHE9_9VIBR|nr:winged helix-turn-helix domain-containing protein [Vibrio hippocampi]CAH0527128.1 hypothetical protein VHP8226_02471 [Vibrio hippocampi]